MAARTALLITPGDLHIVVTTRGHQVFFPNTKKTQKFWKFLLTPGAQAVVQSKNKNSGNRWTEPIQLVCRTNQKKKQLRNCNTAPMRIEHSKWVRFQYDNYFYFLLALIIYWRVIWMFWFDGSKIHYSRNYIYFQ